MPHPQSPGTVSGGPFCLHGQQETHCRHLEDVVACGTVTDQWELCLEWLNAFNLHMVVENEINVLSVWILFFSLVCFNWFEFSR